MDKKEQKARKRALRSQLEKMFPKLSGNSVTFLPESNAWEVWLSVDFDTPEELSYFQKGLDEDIRNEKVISYMKEKMNELIAIMESKYQAKYKEDKVNDFNFTVPLPPVMRTINENGILRLKTKEELERDKERFPTLKYMIEADDRLIEQGYYEFKGEEVNSDFEGFILVKYADLRARFTFILPYIELEAVS